MDSVHETVNKPGFGTFFRIFLRSFFLQGSWSQTHRQNLGFAYCMEPVGKILWTDPVQYARFLKRHTDYYNGNPFMSTLVLGAVVRMEETLRHGSGVTEDDIRRFKKVAGPATGSVGDGMFWSALRPFALVLGLLCAVSYGIYGAVVFLATFNIPACILRWYWLRAGYRHGHNVITELKNRRIRIGVRIMDLFGGVLIGLLAVLYLAQVENGIAAVYLWSAILFILSFTLLRRRYPLYLVFPASVGIAVVAGMVM